MNEGLGVLALAGMLVLALMASTPGVAVELGVRDALPSDAVHAYSYASGSWVCLMLLLAALLAQLGNRLSSEGVKNGIDK